MNLLSEIPQMKSTIVSIGAAFFGTATKAVAQAPEVIPPQLDIVNTVFQLTAWTVAIIAGIISAINGFYKLRANRKLRDYGKG
jgi:hypothetical protein